MIDPNYDVVPTLRLMDGLMTNKAADEIENLRAEVAALKRVTLVRFVGIDPLKIGQGAVLPMIPDSWRFSFYKVGNELCFGFQDNGPLVAYAAVEPTTPGNPEDYLRGQYGAYRGHPAWRELERAFKAGCDSASPLLPQQGGERTDLTDDQICSIWEATRERLKMKWQRKVLVEFGRALLSAAPQEDAVKAYAYEVTAPDGVFVGIVRAPLSVDYWEGKMNYKCKPLFAAAVLPQVGENSELENIRELLKNPVAVHNNMLAGTIAKIDMTQLAHVHGGDTLDRWLAFQRWEQGIAPAGLGEAKAVAPEGLAEILCEAAEILNLVDRGNPPSNMRWPIIDELQGFAYMLKAAAPVDQALPVAVETNRWKLAAEYQHALRVYPDRLELGQGALNAWIISPSFDAAIATMQGEKT